MNDAENWHVNTNYFRELISHVARCMHHMALIRININELRNLDFPENFGVTPSTMPYKKQCAQ